MDPLVAVFYSYPSKFNMVSLALKKCDASVYKELVRIIKKTKEFRKAYMRTGTTKVLRMGVVPGRVWRSKAPGMAPTQKVPRERSAQSRSRSSWRSTTWRSNMHFRLQPRVSYVAKERHRTSRCKLRCEMKDVGITLPQWQVFKD